MRLPAAAAAAAANDAHCHVRSIDPMLCKAAGAEAEAGAGAGAGAAKSVFSSGADKSHGVLAIVLLTSSLLQVVLFVRRAAQGCLPTAAAWRWPLLCCSSQRCMPVPCLLLWLVPEGGTGQSEGQKWSIY